MYDVLSRILQSLRKQGTAGSDMNPCILVNCFLINSYCPLTFRNALTDNKEVSRTEQQLYILFWYVIVQLSIDGRIYFWQRDIWVLPLPHTITELHAALALATCVYCEHVSWVSHIGIVTDPVCNPLGRYNKSPCVCVREVLHQWLTGQWRFRDIYCTPQWF
jgi:hypothetical protein